MSINRMISSGFLIDVARQRIPGFSSVSKFGINNDLGTGTTPEEVWDAGGLYNFSAAATEYSISSSDNGDTQDIELQVLTEDSEGNWNQEVFTATLAGQTPVALAPPSGDSPIRIFRMRNVGSSDIAGSVYAYETTAVSGGVPTDTSKIRAQINDGINQTEMAIYTVPSGKRGLLLKWYCQVDRAVAGTINATLRTRENGSVFQVKADATCNSQGTGVHQYEYPVPLVFSAKTDILVRVDEVSANNMGVAAGFELLLEDIE